MANISKNIKVQFEFLCAVIRYVRISLCIFPVSYTHLRAHETVLDLVCRLLLEKKKKVDET